MAGGSVAHQPAHLRVDLIGIEVVGSDLRRVLNTRLGAPVVGLEVSPRNAHVGQTPQPVASAAQARRNITKMVEMVTKVKLL